MNSIRKLITTSTPSLFKSSISSSSSGIINPSRSVVYLHKGPRVRGLLRDESEYLLSPKGKKYGEEEENLSNLKKFLGDEYKLPNNLILQVLTHKSFAHGFKPFNEKLAIFGSHYLKYKTSLFSINGNGDLSSQYAVNGLELGQLGSKPARDLISKHVLAQFIRFSNIGDSIFWKKRDPLITNSEVSGEDSVFARTLEALIGALLLQHGKAKTEKFVDEILLNESRDGSLVQIVNKNWDLYFFRS